MKKNYLLVGCLLLFTLVRAQHEKVIELQEIKVYHGTKGTSIACFPGTENTSQGWIDTSNIILAANKGTTVRVHVLNPNPFFYTYELKVNETVIKEEDYGLADLVAIINTLPDLATPSSGFNSLSFKAGSPFATYRANLTTLYGEVNQVKEWILSSDDPENENDVLNNRQSGGLKGIKDNMNAAPGFRDKYHFNNDNLAKDLDAAAEAAVVASVADGSIPAEAKDFTIDAYKLVNKKLVQSIDDIKEKLNAPRKLTFTSPALSDKEMEVRLIIKKLDPETKTGRDVFDVRVCRVRPYFQRKTIELIPLLSLIYAPGKVPSYSLENGVIKEGEGDGFRFRPGLMALFNLTYFGPYKGGAFGVGLGYSAPKKGVFESFNIVPMVSLNNVLRVGAGFGFSAYPSGLKDGAVKDGPLPDNIKNLEDVIQYKNKPSFFISFSIAGITLLSKKE